MSVVWLALDTATQRSVALKIMTAITEDDRRNLKANERFIREIDIARSLRHPHILPVIDFGDTLYNGRIVPFFVSPYIEEGSLAELITTSPPWECWSLSQTADVIRQAAESLWYLHTRIPHIVHEDVKPANFLVRSIQSPQRVVHLYLCDFGIARWQKTPSMTASEVLGTFAFMAPEQTEKKVTPASDQYALAIMACLLLTGKLPIQAATNEEYIYAHLYEPPQLPSQLNPQRMPVSEVDDVISRALEKSPSRRFPTIMAFAEALERAMTKLTQTSANMKTERLDVAALDTIYLDKAEVIVSPHIPPAVQLSENIAISIDITEKGERQVLDEPLPEKSRKTNSRFLPPENILFRPLALKGPSRYMLPARPKLLSWSPDGNLLACTLYGNSPLYIGRDGSVSAVQISATTHASSICWSPDGSILAIGSQGEIHFWNVFTGAELPLILSIDTRAVDGLDWSVRGQLAVWVDTAILLYSLPSEALAARQLPTPRRIPTAPMRSSGADVLRWSSDGSLLAAGASNGAILCWNIDSQASPWQVTMPGQKVNSLAWSPEGLLLAAAFRDNRVVAWDSGVRDSVMQWEKLPAMPRTLSISTEQRIMIASSERRLLSGLADEIFPSTTIPGQLLVACSPAYPEFATLDEQSETTLTIWRE